MGTSENSKQFESSNEFNFADFIDYAPEPEKNKFEASLLPETLLQSAAPPTIPFAENEVFPSASTYVTSKPDNFEQLLAHIRDFHGQLDMDELKGKTIEMCVCNICYAIYARSEQLREHYMTVHAYVSIESETEEIETEANDCQAVAIPSKAIEVTQEETQTSQPAIVKDEIDSDWQQPISLIALRKKLNKVFTSKCSLNGCSYQFETDVKRQMHEKCHVSTDAEQIRQFKCLQCSNEWKMWRDCTTHMWKEHKIDIDLLKCPFCSFKAVFAVKVFRHLQSHGQLAGFLCSSCPQSFEQFNQLRQHLATVHIDRNAPSRWYSKKTCDICSNEFATSKTLSKHIKAVHNRIKPFICNVCGYKSARKSTWEIHMRQHTGEKPMSCKWCFVSFADPSVLRKHEMRHNDKTKYLCTECGYTAIQSINLKNHMKRHHPEYYQKLLCDQCNFVSVNLDALRKHLQDHKLGLIRNEDSNDGRQGTASKLIDTQTNNHNRNVEISSDSFLPIESTDSLAHDAALDTGGVTIPAQHSDEAQFPHFEN